MRTRFGLALLGSIGLLLFLRKKARPGAVIERRITLVTRDGRCAVEEEVEPVTLSWSKKEGVRWIITNAAESGTTCHREVRVCLGGWKWFSVPAQPPVKEPEGGSLCRNVSPGQPPQQITAVVRPLVLLGSYKYDILADDEVILDPMVEIVL